MAEYSSLKVADLKKHLQERSLATTGNKADLVARLLEDDKEKAASGAKVGEASGALVHVRRLHRDLAHVL